MLIGHHLLTIIFVYVFARSDWLSLHGFSELPFLRTNRNKNLRTHMGVRPCFEACFKPIGSHTLGHLTLP